VPGLDDRLADQVVEMVGRLRELELRKSPSIAESIDWAHTLLALDARHLDAVRALGHLSLLDRESLRASYAATLVKRSTHRTAFDTVFDLFFPALLGAGIVPAERVAP